MSVVRVYHFLPAEYALDDIGKRRIKVARIDQLNDPFELWSASLKSEELRKHLHDFRQAIGEQHGLLCFCRDWCNPLLWSHYADKHQGMCLGFDLEEPRRLMPVNYVEERLSIEYPFPTEDLQKIVLQVLNTKYIDWHYEKEGRVWMRLIDCDREKEFYFCKFDENLRLKEVIAGALCDVKEAQIREALGNMNDVDVIKASLADRTYRIVRRGWRFDSI